MSKRAGKLATRYAKALLRASTVNNQELSSESLISLSESLLSVSRLWQENKELRDVILNPMFEKTQRQSAFIALAKMSGQRELLTRFLEVVFEKDRIIALPEIAAEFSELAARQARNVAVKVKIARSISSDESKDLELSLGQHIPGNLKFSWEVDPSILGGILVEYQGRVLDGTLSGKLERIEKALLQ